MPSRWKLAQRHLRDAGFQTDTFPTPDIAELSKLLETTYFGVLIGWAQEVERLAAQYDGSYDDVVSFIKEVDFLPSHIFPGVIGGHCVMPNIAILRQHVNSDFLEAVVNSNEAKAQEKLTRPNPNWSQRSMTKVGLIGLGYWGPNLARVFQQTPMCELAACCDLDPKKLQKMSRQYPQIRTFDKAKDLFDSDVDAVAIATSISTHYDLARQALLSGKHVFVEKPLTDNSEKALELAAMAKKLGLTLMAGHTFIYSPPVVRVKNLITSGALGDLHYISFSRVNLGLYQKDVDVIWDLAVHDVSILLYWLGEEPVQAFSFGRSCIQQSKYDVAFLSFRFRQRRDCFGRGQLAVAAENASYLPGRIRAHGGL